MASVGVHLLALLFLVTSASSHGVCGPPDPLKNFWQSFTLTDSTGKNTFDMGFYDRCVGNATIHGRYCRLRAAEVEFGVCVPDTCTASDFTNRTNGLYSLYVLPVIPLLYLLAPDPSSIDVYCGPHSVNASTGSYAALGVFATLLLLVLTATVLHLRAAGACKCPNWKCAWCPACGWCDKSAPSQATATATQPLARPLLRRGHSSSGTWSDDSDGREDRLPAYSLNAGRGGSSDGSISEDSTGDVPRRRRRRGPTRNRASDQSGDDDDAGKELLLDDDAQGTYRTPSLMEGPAVPIKRFATHTGAGLIQRSFGPPLFGYANHELSPQAGVELRTTGRGRAMKLRDPVDSESRVVAHPRVRGRSGSSEDGVDRDDSESSGRHSSSAPVKAPVSPDRPRSRVASKRRSRMSSAAPSVTCCDGIVRSFSLIRNWRRMMAIDKGGGRRATSATSSQQSESLAALHGVRVLSLVMLFVGESLQFMRHIGLENADEAEQVTQSWIFQPVIAFADGARDVLLLCTGVLVALPTLRRFRRQSKTGAWAFAVLHRFARLLPVYGAVLFSQWLVAPLLGEGPFWSEWFTIQSNCREWGWSNLLFVNNFVPTGANHAHQCVPGGWYLAVEMQLIVLVTPLLLALYDAVPLVGAVTTVVFTVGSLLCGGILVHYYSLEVGPYVAPGPGAGQPGGTGSGMTPQYIDKYLTKPYTRAPPYLLGIMLAFVWLTLERAAVKRQRQQQQQRARIGARSRSLGAGEGNPNNNKPKTSDSLDPGDGADEPQALQSWLRRAFPTRLPPPRRFLSRSVAQAILATAVVALILVILGGQPRNVPEASSTALDFTYAVFARTIHAAAMGGVCLVCWLGRGGTLGSFLGWTGWQPLSRLTYAAYLAHPVLLRVVYLSMGRFFRYTSSMLAAMASSNVVLAYLWAAALYLTVEGPFLSLEAILLGSCGCLPVDGGPQVEEAQAPSSRRGRASQRESQGDGMHLFLDELLQDPSQRRQLGSQRLPGDQPPPDVPVSSMASRGHPLDSRQLGRRIGRVNRGQARNRNRNRNPSSEPFIASPPAVSSFSLRTRQMLPMRRFGDSSRMGPEGPEDAGAAQPVDEPPAMRPSFAGRPSDDLPPSGSFANEDAGTYGPPQSLLRADVPWTVGRADSSLGGVNY